MLSLSEHIYAAGFLRGELSDVKIVAFKKEYNLHKLILDRSPYFHSLFSAKWDTEGRPVHNLDFSIDHNITEQAFDQCLQRLYGGAEEPSEILGFPERVSAAFELFATANFLNLTELVDFCLLLIINSLTKYTVAETLCFALENHYPQSETIIDSCKSFLCAEGSEMSYIQWSRIPIPIVVEVVSSDGFFIQSEWERCMWVVGFLTEEDYLSDFNNNDSPIEPEADEDSDSSSNFDIGLEKLSLNAEINLSTPTGSYTELNRLGTEPIGSPEQIKKASPEEDDLIETRSTTSVDSETASQLNELTKSIHYCHLSLAQLQHLEKIKDKRGKLLFDKSVLQAGLWQQMKLKQLVLGTGDDRLDVCMSPKQLMDLGCDIGNDTELFYPVPSHDKSVAGRRSNDSITAKSYYTGRCDPEAPLETSDPDAQVTFSPFPPFRFSVKFDDISQLKGESKLYTDNAVWYAGTWWSVYLQKINKKSPQLGVYLHREARTQRDIATGANSSYTLLSGKSTAKSTVGLDDTTAMELKTEPRLVSFPATEQPADYNDDRPQIMSYFEIYTPSKRGKNLTCFSSSPSAFSCAQSWGWRSSSLYHYAEENAKQHTRASLKFMVVIGVV